MNNGRFQQDVVTCHLSDVIIDLLRLMLDDRSISRNGDMLSWIHLSFRNNIFILKHFFMYSLTFIFLRERERERERESETE